MTRNPIPESPPRVEVPYFRYSFFPASESDARLRLFSNLSSLNGYPDRFFYANRLFDDCERMLSGELTSTIVQRSGAWMSMAARDGAMSLFHFDRCLTAIRRGASEVKRISSTYDAREIRSVRRDFAAVFPNFEDLRHAVAHAGELTKDEESSSQNQFEGSIRNGFAIPKPGAGFSIFVGEALNDRRFSATINSKLVSYELSWGNWRFLYELTLRVMRAFTPSTLPP